jgi:hypothetical protein
MFVPSEDNSARELCAVTLSTFHSTEERQHLPRAGSVKSSTFVFRSALRLRDTTKVLF